MLLRSKQSLAKRQPRSTLARYCRTEQVIIAEGTRKLELEEQLPVPPVVAHLNELSALRSKNASVPLTYGQVQIGKG